MHPRDSARCSYSFWGVRDIDREGDSFTIRDSLDFLNNLLAALPRIHDDISARFLCQLQTLISCVDLEIGVRSQQIFLT
jgi:hypothetical protein